MGNPFSTRISADRDRQPEPKKVLSKSILAGSIVLAAAALFEFLYFLRLDPQVMIVFLILFVLLISRITDGYAYGIIAAVLVTLVYDYLIIEPRMGFSFTIGLPITLFIMLIVTFSTSTLMIQMKKQTELAHEREKRALLLYEIRQKLLAARDVPSIIAITNEYLADNLRHPSVFYTGDPLLPDTAVYTNCAPDEDGESFFRSEREREFAHEVFENPSDYLFSLSQRNTAEFRRHVAAHDSAFYVPLVSQGKTLGVIGVYRGKDTLSQPSLLFMQMLASQVASSLELQKLTDEQNKILIESERDKTRAILLRAISHDLRTPLTSILGDSSYLLEQKDLADKDTREKFLTDIKDNAQWLIRIVENLLSVTRVSDETLKLHKTLEAAEEVVAQAVSIVRKRYPDWYIHVRSPEDLLLVPMEATLLSQVLINLLENSIKNSKSGSLIFVGVKAVGAFAEFSVSDNGRGIPEDMLGNLFELHPSGGRQSADTANVICATGIADAANAANTSAAADMPHPADSVDSAKGMGIGLSICKTIITAHGGTITGKNKLTGGAQFTFSLPLQ